MHQISEDDLEGITYKVYLYAIKEGKPVNTRKVQKGVNLSSPSVAFRHLQKLENLGLLEKNAFGDYIVKEKININGNIWVGNNLVPRMLMYCLFFVGLLIIECITVFFKPLDITYIYLIALTLLAITIFSIEGLLLTLKRKKN